MTIFPITHPMQLEHSYKSWQECYQDIRFSQIIPSILKITIPALTVWIGCKYLPPHLLRQASTTIGNLAASVLLPLVSPIAYPTLQLFLGKDELYQHFALCHTTRSIKKIAHLALHIYAIIYPFYEQIPNCLPQSDLIPFFEHTSPTFDESCYSQDQKNTTENDDSFNEDSNEIFTLENYLDSISSYLKDQNLTVGDYWLLNQALNGLLISPTYSFQQGAAYGAGLVGQEKVNQIFQEAVSTNEKVLKLAKAIQRREFSQTAISSSFKSDEKKSLAQLIGSKLFKQVVLIGSIGYGIKYQGFIKTILLVTTGFLFNEINFTFFFRTFLVNSKNPSLEMRMTKRLSPAVIKILAKSCLLRKEETYFGDSSSPSQMIRHLWSKFTQIILLSKLKDPLFPLHFGTSLGQSASLYCQTNGEKENLTQLARDLRVIIDVFSILIKEELSKFNARKKEPFFKDFSA
ncbi:MAG: hypothetical protein QRY72_00560 [Candidatus Rhabdochlamydia sp.]